MVGPTSPPAWVKPQLSKLVKEAPNGPDWLHEIKFDGYRMHARLDAGRVQILTRRGNDWTDKYPAIAKSIARLSAQNAYLDGELCGGAPRWQNRLQPHPERDRYRRGIAGLLPF
jgi:ATP-dependent DNA ligase